MYHTAASNPPLVVRGLRGGSANVLVGATRSSESRNDRAPNEEATCGRTMSQHDDKPHDHVPKLLAIGEIADVLCVKPAIAGEMANDRQGPALRETRAAHFV